MVVCPTESETSQLPDSSKSLNVKLDSKMTVGVATIVVVVVTVVVVKGVGAVEVIAVTPRHEQALE